MFELTAHAPRVLIAEDDRAMRTLVSLSLRRAGLEVIEAHDGTALRAFVDTFIDHPVDLIVTDVCMPGPSGLDVLERLRAADHRTPVIVMTAFADERARERALALGATLFDKPFELTELRVAALRLLAPLSTRNDP